MGRGIILIQSFVLKVINNKRKILIHHEIIIHHDRITQQIVLVVTEVCTKHQSCGFVRTSGQVSHLLIHLSSLTLEKEFHLKAHSHV